MLNSRPATVSEALPPAPGAARFGARAAACALLGIVLSGPLAVALVSATHPQPPWRDAALFARSYHPVQLLPYLGGIVLVASLVALIASLHALARAEHKALPQPAAAPGPGRPKLGVVSREISLLPRHWEFLEAEPNGISAALRKLVEEALKRDPGAQLARRARDATGRFMTVMAGNLAGFEEASRALYARDYASFEKLIAEWPSDIREHVKQLATAISDWNA